MKQEKTSVLFKMRAILFEFYLEKADGKVMNYRKNNGDQHM